MSWISFVVVVLLFYNPFLELGTRIEQEEIPVPAPLSSLLFNIFSAKFLEAVSPYLGLSGQPVISYFSNEPFRIPYSGYIRLFLYAIAIWWVLWQVLNRLDTLFERTLLQRLDLRNGMLYAVNPRLSNNFAVILAGIFLAVTVFAIAFDLIVTVPKVLTFLQSAPNFSPSALALLTTSSRSAFLSLHIHPRAIVLSVFTLIVAMVFCSEKGHTYKLDIMRNQIRRKREQREIIVP